jgi:hypothetical protein
MGLSWFIRIAMTGSFSAPLLYRERERERERERVGGNWNYCLDLTRSSFSDLTSKFAYILGTFTWAKSFAIIESWFFYESYALFGASVNKILS